MLLQVRESLPRGFLPIPAFGHITDEGGYAFELIILVMDGNQGELHRNAASILSHGGHGKKLGFLTTPARRHHLAVTI
jgi:hypothetical protein